MSITESVPRRLRAGRGASAFLGVLLVVASGIALADQGPESVAEAYYTAFASRQWETALKQVRPQDVTRLREAVLRDKGIDRLRQRCFDGASMQAIARMNDIEVASCLFKSVFASYDEAGIAFSGPTFELVGSVAENSDMVHFVVRSTTTVAKETTVRMEVLTVVKEEGVWRVTLPQASGTVK